MRREKPGGPLRSLPRVFIPGASTDEAIEIPEFELQKIRKVLRLGSGSEIAVLPNDGSLIRCVIDGRRAKPLETSYPSTESSRPLFIAQALPKGDKLDEIVRACTEIGVAGFLLFNSDRTVVSWDDRKLADRVHRLEVIAREASETSFRTRIPTIEWLGNLATVLETDSDAVVLSEKEGIQLKLWPLTPGRTIVVGPEGGWSSTELEQIGERGVTLGPRVLRVDHAAPAAAAILLLSGS